MYDAPGRPEKRFGSAIPLAAGLSGTACCRGGSSSPPPRPRPASPGSSPSTAARGRAPPPSSASRAKCGREASGSAANGGIVERPTTRTGQAGDELAELGRDRLPPLPSSPATLTCTRTSTSVAGVLLELARDALGVAPSGSGGRAAATSRTLRLCRLPMKSHVNSSPQRSCFASRSREPVLADQRRPPPPPARPSPRTGTYLPATRTSTPGRRPRREPARGWRATRVGSMSRNISTIRRSSLDDPGLPTGVAGPPPRWEKNRSWLQRVQRPASSISATPARSSSRRATSLRSSIRPSASPGAERREGRQDLVADLVAAGPDPGADRGGGRRRRLHPGRRRSRGQPAPAAVEHRHAPGPASAIGRQSATKTSGARPGTAVTWPSTSGGSGLGAAQGAGFCGPSWTSDRRRRGPGARSGPGPARPRARRRAGGGCATTISRSSSVSTPRLRLSNAPALTPPSRVEKAATAPGSSASSHRRPSPLAPAHRRRRSQIRLSAARRARPRARARPRGRRRGRRRACARSAPSQTGADRRSRSGSRPRSGRRRRSRAGRRRHRSTYR